MGSFQSKKKYDVATGESSIKVRNPPTTRNERKRDHIATISQSREVLNKFSTQADQQSVNGVKSTGDISGENVSEPKTSDIKAVDENPHPHENQNIEEDITVTVPNEYDVTKQENLQDEKMTAAEEEEEVCCIVPSANKVLHDEVISNNDAAQKNSDIIQTTLENSPEITTSAINEEPTHKTPEEYIHIHEVNTSSAPPEVSNEVEIQNDVEPHIIGVESQKIHNVIEEFINEERKTGLPELTPKLDDEITVKEPQSDEIEEIEEIEHEAAITVLNEVIEEAGDDLIKINQAAKNDDASEIELSKQEPARKSVIFGDPPTQDEITKASGERELDDKNVVSDQRDVQKSQLELHEVSIVSQSVDGQKNEEKVVSHIYLESINGDDVHYTLDKLQLMDEQIHTTRARIMSIKEID